jgi:hypothetical protein
MARSRSSSLTVYSPYTDKDEAKTYIILLRYFSLALHLNSSSILL